MNELLTQLLDLQLLDQQIFHTDSYDSDEGGPFFWLAGPIGAVGFYSYIYLRYRNTNKRHEYEKKTYSEIGEVSGSDNIIGKVKGVQNSQITGQNSTSPRLRLGARSTFVETWRQTESE